MVAEIRLPPLGQTSDEMSIIEWYKKVGDTIAIAEPLLCVETDKANVDVESAEEGIVLQILAEPGELLPSGSLLAYIGAVGESLPSTDPVPEPAAAESAEDSGDLAPAAPAVLGTPSPSGRVRAAPAVRKLASDLGVDITALVGTGRDGAIERRDVQSVSDALRAAVVGVAPVPSVPPAPPATAVGLTDVPPLRRVIARRLVKSTQNIPVFRISADLNASAAKRSLAAAGKGLTYTHLLLRAVARALREHPVMMRLWIEDGPKFRTLTEPNVGLAVAGDDSLYVVTILAPDRTTLPELTTSVAAAADRGRRGVLLAQDQAPATITISNLGMFGVSSFDAIIDPDQNAILAAGAVADAVVAIDGMFAVRPMLSVTLSCDHRAVDGAQAARFLRTLQSYFENDPEGVDAT